MRDRMVFAHLTLLVKFNSPEALSVIALLYMGDEATNRRTTHCDARVRKKRLCAPYTTN